MAKSYKNLRSKMPLSAQARANVKAKIMIREMNLQDLKQQARHLSQERLAALLHTKQANISKIQHRTDSIFLPSVIMWKQWVGSCSLCSHPLVGSDQGGCKEVLQ